MHMQDEKDFVGGAISILLAMGLLTPLLVPAAAAQSLLTVAGRVDDPEGDYLSGVSVQATNSTGHLMAGYVTADDGWFYLRVPANASYYLEFSKRGYYSITQVVYVGVRDVQLGDTTMNPMFYEVELSSTVTELGVRAGATTTVPVTIKNLNNYSADLTFKARVPNDDWRISITDRSGNRIYGLSLGPKNTASGSASMDLVVDVPLAASGPYQISLKVPQYYVAKLSFTLYVEPVRADDIVYVPYSELVSAPGESVSFSVTVNNPLDSIQRIAVWVEAPNGWEWRVFSGSLQITALTLRARASAQLQVEILIPKEVRESTYNADLSLVLGATAFHVPLKVTVSNEAHPVSDFLFTSYTHLVAAPGDTAKFVVKLTNPYNTLQAVDVRIDAPLNWSYVVISGSSRILGLTLGAKQSVNVEVQLTVPEEAKDGTYRVLLTMASESVNATLPLKVTVSRASAIAQIELSSRNPYQEAYGGRSVKYDFTIKMSGNRSDLVDLDVSGLPTDFTAAFQDAKGQAVRRVYIEAGSQIAAALVVTVPEAALLGTIRINVTAAVGGATTYLPLTLEMVGRYSVSILTQNLFTSVTIGESQSFSITATNDGTQDLTNVRVEIPAGALPQGLSVTSTPTSIAVLRRGDQAPFTLKTESTTDLAVGTYPIPFILVSDQARSAQSILTVQAVQASNILWIGIGIIAAGLAAVALVFRRLGRR